MAALISEVADDQAPSERLYTMPELTDLGWSVGHYSDETPHGLRRKLKDRSNRFVRFFGPGAVQAIRSRDVVLVNGEFSILLTLLARILGKRIVYLDSMFEVPRRFWRRWSVWWNLRLANVTLAYSTSQAQLWTEEFGSDASKIAVVPYGMDLSFYKAVERAPQNYVLAVGRDLGRDYATLFSALKGTGIRLKLVTLPYLLPESWRDQDWLDVFERVSYEELFELYAGALASVVPLKSGMTYPSGIRAVYEAALLGVPTIASQTPVLAEAFEHGVDLWFVPPEDPASLTAALIHLRDHADRFEALVQPAANNVRKNFSLQRSAASIDAALRAVIVS